MPAEFNPIPDRITSSETHHRYVELTRFAKQLGLKVDVILGNDFGVQGHIEFNNLRKRVRERIDLVPISKFVVVKGDKLTPEDVKTIVIDYYGLGVNEALTYAQLAIKFDSTQKRIKYRFEKAKRQIIVSLGKILPSISG